MTSSFDDWVAEAKSVSALDAANMVGAKLKRAGRDYKGPCPAGCSSKDGFIVTPDKNLFLCRKGDAHGDAIGLVMHCLGLDFKGACEYLNNRPPPIGQRGGIDPQARERAEKRRQENEHRQALADQEEARKAQEKGQRAKKLWTEAVPLKDTPVELYTKNRGILEAHKIPALRAHSHVWHDFARKDHPALLGCVVGPDKRFHGIWRIFTDLEGNKADIEQVKMGLGRPDGGSVWIASQDQMEAEIWGVCEGIETALSIRELFHDLPVFAALSTSGMMNFEIPPHVKFLVIFPDGDLATRNNISGWNIPPGELAARKLSERLKESNFSHEIIKPPQHSDWNDVLVDAVSKGLR